MEIPVDYDNTVEQQRTHPLLLPKIEPMSLLCGDTEILKKVKVIVPKKVIV